MTLSTTANKVSYAGDGATTAFAIPFLFLETAHVGAILRDADGNETTWALNTQFALSGAGSASGGTLTVSTSPTDYTPASGETLVIRRIVPETQDTDYPEGGAFPAAAHEQALDKLTMLVQQHSEEIARAPVLPVSSALPDITVPEPGASEVIRWNAAGTALETAAIADLSLDFAAEIDTPARGHTLTYNGSLWANRTTGIVNAFDLGATGDGVTDDTAALQAAIDTAAGNAPLFLPGGIYRITAPLDARGAALKMQGGGVNATVISQHTDNVAILKVGTGGPHIADMQLRYNDPQGIANTGANAIEFYGTNYGVFERLNLYRCNRGMYVPQESVVEGSNYLFSCSIRDILVNYYSNNGMDLSGYNGGISGNVMSNIFLLGRDDIGTKLETNEALVLGAWSNSHISQLNIESSKPTQPVYLNTCESLTFDGVHFEQVEPRTDYGGFIDVAGNGHVFNGVTVRFCQITVANLMAIFRTSAEGTKIRATATNEGNSTITTANWRMFNLSGSETGVEVYADLVSQSGITSAGSSTSDPSAIRRYAGVVFGTYVTPYELTEMRQVAALKDALPDTPNGITLGLGDAAASVITGTTTNGGAIASASETLGFFVRVPNNYDNSSWPVFRYSAKVSAARNVSATIDMTAQMVGADGALGSEICFTAAQNLTTFYANYDFTVGGATLLPGALVYVTVTLATDDTAGSTNGFPTLAQVQMRTNAATD